LEGFWFFADLEGFKLFFTALEGFGAHSFLSWRVLFYSFGGYFLGGYWPGG